ncbi:DNA-methyltransferase [Staphylococcus ratti]|uniref:Methyltransferase n=1 Tax=Staphylococcus ratti TaxID=2892440 RepID=A0ABY3PDH4_9STAP|nr:site-specific DNA-methyltransferase [Staphylococcus ratti]UEX90298.1 site-specific DNA-methyltransferase [Staphylococcus ratti]
MKEYLYFNDEVTSIYLGDSLKLLKLFEKNTIDMIFADPPYFLSSGGITNSGGKMVCVNKGEWDKSLSLSEKIEFNKSWLQACHDLLTDNGTIWISGTLHNIYSIGVTLEETGYKILNNITWQKTNPPPNLGCRNFTHSTETILWARKNSKKSKHFFNYDLMKSYNNNKQMKDVWTGSLTSKNEKKFGKHPTQKPLYLLERIIEASTKPGDIILDPFLGSGTTGVASKKLDRNFIGIDIDKAYTELSKRRIENTIIESKLF